MKFQPGSIRRSLRYSLWDGLFTAMMFGVSEFYIVPYGIALEATAMEIAILASLPLLLAAILQTYSARVTQYIGSRTKLINVMVFFHALLWLPIIIAPQLSGYYGWPITPAQVLIIVMIVFCSVGAFSVPAWQSLMSDYIPTLKRGKYFGWRNRLQGLLTTTVMVLTGLTLHGVERGRLRGFTIVLTFAMFCRFAAWWCLTRMTEPYRKSKHDEYFSFLSFIRQIRTSNFAKFVAFVSIMSFSVNLSAPLLSVFVLKDLNFSYAAYMVVITSAALSGFLFQGIWGKYADLFGNFRVLKVVGWGIATAPLLWLVSRDLSFLVFVQILGGAFWGGFNLLILNFIMEAASPQKRIRCLSYFNVMNAFAVFLGASLGGWLWHRMPELFGYSFLALFLLSCSCRILTMVFVSRQVREVRTV